MNEYFQPSSVPSQNSPGTSAVIRAEFTAIATAFNKLPLLAGKANKLIQVNGSGTALVATDILDSLATTAGLANHEADTSTHGSSGDLVGELNIQTLENKTLVVSDNSIITAAAGNLAATELNAALAELQGDIDTRSPSTLTVQKTSASGAALLPVGTTAEQPGVGQFGMLRGNQDTGSLEYFTGTAWGAINGSAVMNEESFTATEGQTVFVTDAPYTVGVDALSIFINGLEQASTAYTETDNHTVTFSEGLSAGDHVEMRWGTAEFLSETDASLVSYLPAGTGAVPTTVQNKLRESVSVKDFGAVGDGITDDTAAFKAAIAGVRDNTFLTIPEGTYIVDVDDVDVVSSGDSRNYTVGLVSGKTGVGIGGPGTIKFISSRSTRRNFLLTFKDCTRVDINTLNVEGEFSPQEGVPNSEVGIGYGVYLFNSADCLMTASRLRRLIMLYVVSGDASTSVTTSNVSKRVLITGNHFDTFEQNSTFGAGASDVVIDGNTFHNCFCAQKISQNPFNDPASIGAAGRIIFSNNVVTWDSTFQFSEVWFSPGKSQVPYGVQIQAHNHDVVISGNIIDMSNCRSLTLTAITDPAAIISFTSDAGVYADTAFQATRLKISGNTLIGHPTSQQYAAKLTPFYRDVEFTDNLCQGRVTVTGSGGNLALKYGTWKVANNTLRNYGTARAAQISISAGNFNSLTVKDNLLVGDPGVLVLNDRETIHLTTFTADVLTVQGNVSQHGRIGNYAAARFTCGVLNVVGNTIKGVDLATTSVTRASIVGNTVVTDGTAIKLDLDSTTKASAKVKIAGNACSGAANSNSTTAVNLNGGALRMDGNSFDANASTAFVFDASVFLSSGNYYGQGAPAQAALYGTLYADYNLGSAAIYMKTTASGTTGWAKLATV